MAFEYRSGTRIPILVPLDNSSAAIVVGDAITISGANDGYFKEVDGLGEAIFGIAMQDQSSPSADGDLYVQVDVSTESIYEVPPDSGSVTAALAGNTMDCGANARTVDINGSSTDDILCVKADVTNNKLYVRLLLNSYTGV